MRHWPLRGSIHRLWAFYSTLHTEHIRVHACPASGRYRHAYLGGGSWGFVFSSGTSSDLICGSTELLAPNTPNRLKYGPCSGSPIPKPINTNVSSADTTEGVCASRDPTGQGSDESLTVVAHIYPYCLNDRSETPEMIKVWCVLECFWSSEKVNAWKNAISGPNGTEIPPCTCALCA